MEFNVTSISSTPSPSTSTLLVSPTLKVTSTGSDSNLNVALVAPTVRNVIVCTLLPSKVKVSVSPCCLTKVPLGATCVDISNSATEALAPLLPLEPLVVDKYTVTATGPVSVVCKPTLSVVLQ